MAKCNTKSISNRGAFCNFSLAQKRKIYKMSMKHLKIHKFPFKNEIVLAIECKMYLKFNKNCAALIAFQNRDHVLCHEGNKVQFLKGWFLDEKLPFFHQNKAEHCFELSHFIFCPLMVIFNLEMQNSCLENLHGDRAAAICWKWISFTKVSKYGKIEYSRALNASYMFQPLMSFW